jgi:mannose-6-phosphate isomerase-like protein (cupin superfamily)
MSGYTIVNLKEVEDQAPNFGLAPEFEARFARVALDAELIGLTYQRLAPNLTVPWGHTHKTQEEVFLVLSGSVEVKVDGEIKKLGPWDAIRVHKDTPRWFRAGRATPSISRATGTSRQPAVHAPPIVVVVVAEPPA